MVHFWWTEFELDEIMKSIDQNTMDLKYLPCSMDARFKSCFCVFKADQVKMGFSLFKSLVHQQTQSFEYQNYPTQMKIVDCCVLEA